jgi:hypothetical protein
VRTSYAVEPGRVRGVAKKAKDRALRPGLIRTTRGEAARQFRPAGLPWHFQPTDTGVGAFASAAGCAACSVT